MQIAEPAPVVVAVNGTAAGLAATRLGAREAVARGVALRILHAFAWPGTRYLDDPPDYAAARHDAGQIVQEAVATALRTVPGVRVEGRVTDGQPVRELVRQSRSAQLLVLGDDGLAAGPHLPPEAVLVQVVAHARCPVAIARGVRPPAGPVLAAVDGSPCSLMAVRLAAAEARRRQVKLEVAHVVGDAAGAQAGRRLLEQTVGALQDCIPVRPQLLIGDPALVLVRASRRARVMMVGPRGTDSNTLLGAVAAELLCRCACPTVFVHGSSAFVHGTPAGDGPADGTVPSAAALIS
ncbi:universal stress protein [Actinoplanes sp. TFC3]|uniref:universal stress protein n=1 Tax=Actinoplanes sp. TFC3 TaxID=1710355 RepID=UPI0009E8FB0B|nr:universal stress protein [Actinoplanes sp. TFC3]